MRRDEEAMEQERRMIERARINRPASELKPRGRRSVQSERYFNPADALEGLRLKMTTTNPVLPEIPPRCGKCRDSGWQEIDADGRGDVVRCPNGCDIPRKYGQKPPDADLPISRGRVIT